MLSECLKTNSNRIYSDINGEMSESNGIRPSVGHILVITSNNVTFSLANVLIELTLTLSFDKLIKVKVGSN